MSDRLVLDASAMVDLLVGSPEGRRVGKRLAGADVSVPAHFEAEVLSALGRLTRSDVLTDAQASERVALAAAAPYERRPVAPLLALAWSRRHNLRLVDALYVELATQLEAQLVTTDSGLARAAANVELIS